MRFSLRVIGGFVALITLLPAAGISATVDISGIYSGRIQIDGVRTNLALVLRQREARGRIVAVALGGGEGIAIENANIDASDAVEFELVVADQRVSWSGRVSSSGKLVGATQDGARSQFGPIPGRIDERQLVFALLPPGGEPTNPTAIAVALDPAGNLVGGYFTTEEGCGLFGCQGAITRFSEVGDTLNMVVKVGGSCPGRATLRATFDNSSLFYAGTARVRDCMGRRSVDVLGARAMRSNSDDAQSILGALAVLADDLESNLPFGSTHPAFAEDYLDTGRSQQMLLNAFNREQGRYTNIEADFTRIRGLFTVVDPTALPDVLEQRRLGVTFDEFRTGLPIDGVERMVIADSVRRPGLPLLEGWAFESGRWVIRGDQSPALDLPFSYTPGEDIIRIPTVGGTIFASHGAFGAHFGPHTGDPVGEAKANFVGFFTESDADMVELDGDMDGVRDPGELWGYDGGIAGERIRDQRPVYTAPLPAILSRVRFNGGPSFYFDDEPHWEFELRFSDEVRMSFGHVGRFWPDLRDSILGATGVNTDTYTGPVGEILSDGDIVIEAGEPLAFPQVLAAELAAPFEGYYVGGGSFLQRPWAQMEFPVIGVAGSAQESTQVCVYEMLSPTVAEILQTSLQNQMADPTSQRFGHLSAERWKWAAEGRLCNDFSPLPEDFEALDTRFGGWYERAEPATVQDELVAFVDIAKDVPSYDSLLYDSSDVNYLITRLRASPIPFTWTLPGGGSISVFGPAGEVLSLDDSTFLVKWRDIGGLGATPLYQWASYLLNDAGLKIAWGDLLAAPADGMAPNLLDTFPCNDFSVICYDHEGGIPGL